MSSIKFQTDEHIPKSVISGLRRRGIDIRSSSEAGLLGASDERQLAYATEHGRTFITQDDDFLVLHAQEAKHTGIIFIQYGKPVGYMVRGIHFIYQMLTANDMENHVEYL